jgi:hypothetical protein
MDEGHWSGRCRNWPVRDASPALAGSVSRVSDERQAAVRLQLGLRRKPGRQSWARAVLAQIAYTTVPTLVFLVYGGMLFVVLCYFSRLYHQRRISGESWIPVLLVGTTLLNPRIMQYDVHVVALPMVLILVRSVASRSRAGLAVTVGVLGLALTDLFGVNFYSGDDLRNMCVLIAVMAVGLDYLAMEARQTDAESSFVLSEVVALPQPALVGGDVYSPDAGR